MSGLIPLSIGKIKYLNCLPFYFGLEEKLKAKGLKFSFLESHPARLNQAIQKEEINVAPVSSLEYLAHQDDYVLLPELAIVSGTFTRSVILFSKVKIEKLNGAKIALSEESLSSATLLKILLKRRFGFKNEFETVAQDPAQILRKCPAALMIGDEALFFESEDWVYKYDLGEMWRTWTGEPFVFALWVVKRKLAREHPQEVALFLELLRENLRRNLEEPEKLLKLALGMTPTEKRFSQALGFLVSLRYELDERMTAGLLRFYDLAYEEGLAPAPKPLEFFSAAKVI